jgi:hypothetical protein
LCHLERRRSFLRDALDRESSKKRFTVMPKPPVLLGFFAFRLREFTREYSSILPAKFDGRACTEDDRASGWRRRERSDRSDVSIGAQSIDSGRRCA